MRTLRTYLTVLALCTATVALAQTQDLKPGDEVTIQNPEFDNGQTGWTKKNTNFSVNTSDAFCGANRFAVEWGGNVWSIEQTVEGLRNGIYLVQVNAFDMLSSRDKQNVENALADGTPVNSSVFANDQKVKMKSILDDALTGQNIYRFYNGESSYFEYVDDDDATSWMPLNDKAVGVAMVRSKLLYLNSVVCAVTDGKLTIGLQHETKDETRIYWDHFRVTYLSDDVSKLKHLTDSVKNAALSNAALNAVLAQEEETERQGYQMVEVTVAQPGTLGDEIFAKKGNDFNLPDLKRLRIKGQLNEADLTTLRDRCTGLLELDMSQVLNTTLIDNQFQDHQVLRYVMLPPYLEAVPSKAFYQCYSLNTVELPAPLKEIGWQAFYRCYNLREAVLPEGVTKIGDECYCESGLQRVVFPTTLKTIPIGAFRNNYELSDIQFNGQTTIYNSNGAFVSCTHLKKLVMPATMESIGGNAFENCVRLEDVQLNEGLYEIWGSFKGCKALKKLTLPSTMQALYHCPFSDCDNLMELTCLCVAPPFTMHNLISSSGRNNPFGDREKDKGRTVIVPYISQTVYKQTAGWDQHNIETHQQLPKDVFMNVAYNMTWPASLMETWKPNVHITPNFKNTSSEGGNGGMLTYGSLYVGKNASFSADTLSTYYSFYAAKEADRRKYFTPILMVGNGRADHIITEINVPQDFWTFFSLPYDVKASEITSTHPDDPFVIRTYDGKKRAEGKNTEAWVNLTKDSVLHAGQGYIIRTTNGDYYQYYNNFFFPSVNNANKPKYFTNEDVVVTLQNYPTEFAHNRSWNFIGNPYPCYFDIRAMQTTSPITIWNRSGKYETYSPLDDDYVLNPGQALFIQRPLDQSQVVFIKEGRQQNTTIRDTIYYNSARAAAPANRQVFNLQLAEYSESTDDSSLSTLHSSLSDRTRFVINAAATTGYDAGRDASKFFSMEQGVAHLYTIADGVQYAINERPLGDGEIQLGMQLPTAGTYTLTLTKSASLPVTLIDRHTGTETDLTANAYTFRANAGTQNSRFVIRLGGATGIRTVVSGSVADTPLYDLQGRRVSQPRQGVYIKDHKTVILK